jgi:hypothetical protein
LEAGGWRLEAGGWRLEAGGWRLEAGGWRLEAGGWILKVKKIVVKTNEWLFNLSLNLNLSSADSLPFYSNEYFFRDNQQSVQSINP